MKTHTNHTPIFHETVTSLRTTALFVALTALFLLLAVRRLETDGLGFLAVLFLILGAFFVFYVFNYRKLSIRMHADALELRFGLFARTVPWHNIEDAYIDATSLWRIGGAGIHFRFIKRRYRMFLNFLEHPRVVVALAKPRGMIREVAFTTRRPDEALAAIGRMTGRAADA